MVDISYHSRGLFTDFYELTMAQGYFDAGKTHEEATFELFYRRNPFKGGYTIACGVYDIVKFLTNYRFSDEDIAYLRTKKQFSEEFIDHLSALKFEGEIRGLPEGSISFAFVPVIQITGSLGIIQLIETALLNIFNYQSLIATKASRVCLATKRKDRVMEFGLRRAQGDAGIVGARAAVIGGFMGTSNTIAGKFYNIPVLGTQAHSWVQSFDSELESFRAYARSFPDSTTLLVDTYDTLKSGVPNAIKVGLEMQERGEKLHGIRLDSGDLAWLAVKSAEMLDDAGFTDTKIVLSGGLNEYVIESIINQIRNGSDDSYDSDFATRLIDRLVYGMGTHLITGHSEDLSALDGVYKLVQIGDTPVLKLSENRIKTSNPGKKNLWRMKDVDGNWIADVMGLIDETPPVKGEKIYHHTDSSIYYTLEECIEEPLYVDLMKFYEKKTEEEIWKDSRTRCFEQLSQIDSSHLRFLNPHIYKVSLTQRLKDLKVALIQKHEKETEKRE